MGHTVKSAFERELDAAISRMNPELPKIGEEVKLKWTGYPRVPKWLSGDTATVLGYTKQGNLKVQARGESLNVRVIQYPYDVWVK